MLKGEQSRMTEIDYDAVLARKLCSMFPDPSVRKQVEDELNRYGVESYEREVPRVRVDILKVAGASLEKVREWADIAKRDYRDILAGAEYPEELIKPTWNFPLSEQNTIQRRDKGQYLKWIEE